MIKKITDKEAIKVLRTWLKDGRLDIETVLEELTQEQIRRILAKYILKP